MSFIVYTILLSKYGVTYISKVKGTNVIYGYNKSTGQYSFWKVLGVFNLRLVEICTSKTRAVFCYRILSKGV